MKASLCSAVIWVAPRTVVDKVGMNLERDNLWFSPNSVNLEAPAFSGCFFISISLLPGTLLTGGLPSQLEMAIAVQRVRNWQCGLRPTVQPPKCCFFTWTHSKWFKRFFVGCCVSLLQPRLCPVTVLTGLLASNNGSFIAMSSWNDLVLVVSQANFLWIMFS